LKLSRILREWRQLAKPVPPAAELHPVPQNASLVMPLGYRPRSIPLDRKIAIFFHAFYAQELADAIDLLLRNLPFSVDVYFTTDTEEKAALLNGRFQSHPRIRQLETHIAANRGRDIYPKIGLMNRTHLHYDYVLHLHTKKSSHEDQLRDWRQFLWQHLLGSPEIVMSVLDIFERCPDVGMIAPQHFPFIRPWIHWAGCKELSAVFAARLGVTIDGIESIDFPSGSMFWARTKALEPLLDLNLVALIFPRKMDSCPLQMRMP
jgi:lipopolysaccharide biosynthesis protein